MSPDHMRMSQKHISRALNINNFYSGIHTFIPETYEKVRSRCVWLRHTCIRSILIVVHRHMEYISETHFSPLPEFPLKRPSEKTVGPTVGQGYGSSDGRTVGRTVKRTCGPNGRTRGGADRWSGGRSDARLRYWIKPLVSARGSSALQSCSTWLR